MSEKTTKFLAKLSLASICMGLGMVSLTGCQTSIAGQTLPSPYYLYDDVQYFPAGPENKLAIETAKLKEERAKAKQNRR
jgi:hypothetical protein